MRILHRQAVLSKLDRAILAYLQGNPCVTQSELALALGVTRTTCKKALDRLQIKGLLRGSGFVLGHDNPQRVPVEIEGYVLIPGPKDRDKIGNLEEIFESYLDIGCAHLITGGNFDYIFTFYVSGKSVRFAEFIDKIRRLTPTETHSVVKLIGAAHKT